MNFLYRDEDHFNTETRSWVTFCLAAGNRRRSSLHLESVGCKAVWARPTNNLAG